MKLDLGKIITRSWEIIWNYKVLWIFGIFAGFASSNGGSSNSAIGAQVQYFNASGTVVTIPLLGRWALLLLAGLLACLGGQRIRLSHASR